MRKQLIPEGWWECAWREEWTGVTLDNSNITYERLLYSNTGDGVEGAGLDITTGVFTAPYTATWTVTYSATSVQYDGDIIQAGVITRVYCAGSDVELQFLINFLTPRCLTLHSRQDLVNMITTKSS